MKSLAKKLFNTNTGILLRNSFKFRPVYHKNIEKNYLYDIENGSKNFERSILLSMLLSIW